MAYCETCKTIVKDLGTHKLRKRCEWIMNIRDSRTSLNPLQRRSKKQRAIALKGDYRGGRF